MNEIKTIELVIWKDANQHMHHSLVDENFCLSDTCQFGFVDKENDELLRLVSGYSDDRCGSDDCDFMNIPITCIDKRIIIGHFNTKTFKFTPHVGD